MALVLQRLISVTAGYLALAACEFSDTKKPDAAAKIETIGHETELLKLTFTLLSSTQSVRATKRPANTRTLSHKSLRCRLRCFVHLMEGKSRSIP